MGYLLHPAAGIWREGAVCIPRAVCEKHLKFADENKLKVLLLLSAQSAACDAAFLAEKLKLSIGEVAECLEFWEGEGILLNTEEPAQPAAKTEETAPEKKPYEALPMLSHTPRDIVALCTENEELGGLLRSAEKIMMASLSNAMKSNIVNMVIYYGLPVPVVVTLLNYYKDERDAGKNMTTRHLNAMAKEWADEEVTTLEQASKKLQERISCNELWGEVLSLCGFDYKKPTGAQLKMLQRWRDSFDKEMIFFACNTMKKYTEEAHRSLRGVDNILKEWNRKGFKTPQDVKSQPKKKEQKDSGRLKSKPSFDIEALQKNADLNDDFDI